MASPSICVIIAAANAEGTIARAVRTALQQEFVSEVIVVDDASRDNTAGMAAKMDDGSGRLSVITVPVNAGPAAARNAAIKRSTAEFFSILDADDYLLPERMAHLMRSGDLNWDFLADDIIIVPELLDGDTFSLTRHDKPQQAPIEIDLETFVRGNITLPGRHRQELGFLKPIIRRSFLTRNGLQYDDRLRLGEDYALYVTALMAGARFRIVSACGYIAVERGNSISSRHSTRDLRNIVEFDKEVLKSQAKLSPSERAAVRAHLRAVTRNSDHRYILDRKREAGSLNAIASLLHVPSSVPHIAIETVRIRLRRLRPSTWLGGKLDAQPRMRFLIGTPGAEISRPATAKSQHEHMKQ